jgi:capsular exopolysaccharide synthesis family protein
MSRIQNILDKAEREGGVLRMRSLVETPPAVARVAEVTPMPSPAQPVMPIAEVAPPVAPGSSAAIAAPTFVPVATPAFTPVGVPAFAPVGTPAFVPAATPPAVVAPAPSTRAVRSTGFDPALIAALAPGAPVAEQYRALRTRLATVDHSNATHVLLVTSPGRGEGKTLTATNLALTIAQDCQTRVCIVDADLRHPRIHAVLGVPAAQGLADVLAGDAALADVLVTIEGQQIAVLPAGKPPAHPAELLGSMAMRRLLQTLRVQFDRVIVDAPSALPLADIGILAPIVDSVVLVVQAGVTTKPAIQDAVSTIGSDRVLGVVLNGTAAA